jgi:hypothetical protein
MADYRLLGRINALELQLERYKREQSGAECIALSAAQARADSVAAMFGESASPPIAGESPLDYRKRLATGFQKHSPQLQDSRLLKAMDAGSFALCEERIYNDAAASAHSAPPQAGMLKAIESRDAAGRLVTKFVGDIGCFLQPFSSSGASVQLNRKP